MKKRRTRNLDLNKVDISNLEKVNGGAARSVVVCQTDLCVSKIVACPPPPPK
jgi:hypothetical protein